MKSYWKWVNGEESSTVGWNQYVNKNYNELMKQILDSLRKSERLTSPYPNEQKGRERTFKLTKLEMKRGT